MTTESDRLETDFPHRRMQLWESDRHAQRRAPERSCVQLLGMPKRLGQRIHVHLVLSRIRRRRDRRRASQLAPNRRFGPMDRIVILRAMRQHGVPALGSLAGDLRGSSRMLRRSDVRASRQALFFVAAQPMAYFSGRRRVDRDAVDRSARRRERLFRDTRDECKRLIFVYAGIASGWEIGKNFDAGLLLHMVDCLRIR